MGTDARGNITRIDNVLANISVRMERVGEKLTDLVSQQESAKAELGKPFPQEKELTEKSARLAELDSLLNMEEHADGQKCESVDTERSGKRISVLAQLKEKAETVQPQSRRIEREEVL